MHSARLEQGSVALRLSIAIAGKGGTGELPDQTPALVAVRNAVETARAASSMAGGHE